MGKVNQPGPRKERTMNMYGIINPYTIHKQHLMDMWYEKYQTFNPITFDDVFTLAKEWVNAPWAFVWDNKEGQEEAAIMEAASLIATKLPSGKLRAEFRRTYKPQNYLYHPQ